MQSRLIRYGIDLLRLSAKLLDASRAACLRFAPDPPEPKPESVSLSKLYPAHLTLSTGGVQSVVKPESEEAPPKPRGFPFVVLTYYRTVL